MLETVDLKKKLSKGVYRARMEELQRKLGGQQYAANAAGQAIIICLEGWEMSGKGELIKKLSAKLDPRVFRVHPGTAPTPLEQRYHFLWRFQVGLPNYGQMALFDGSWYARVLAERCEKLTRKKVWKEAYGQINEFERWLTDDGQILLKFWVHISKKEQRKRMQQAKCDRTMRWKVTAETRQQHRHHERWLQAVEEMLAKTETPDAPWTVIEGTDTRWARVRFLEAITGAMERALPKPETTVQESAGAARVGVVGMRQHKRGAGHPLGRFQSPAGQREAARA
jgi:AMP-polyphosphate phosphotransferase